jgi:iron complex outermembrane receptor protein
LSLTVDGLTKLGLVPGLNAQEDFPGGSRETTAGFIEVSIPVLGKDQAIPGFYKLEVDVAGRYQVFDPGGSKAVPKVSARWQPIDDQFTIRGGYSQGFIAPSIFNLFGPDFVSNPSVTIAGTPGQVNTTTRHNAGLKPSNSDQFGAGIVVSPKVLKGLTVGVDYYHVTEDNLPVADAQSAANSLNALGVNSPYAPGFTFSDGSTITTPAKNQVTVDNWGNLIIPWTGAQRLRTEGLDLSLSYVLPLDERFGKVTLGTVANVIIDYEVSTGTGRPYFDYVGTWTVNQGLIPDYNLTAYVTYEYSGWTATASVHYLPATSDPGGLFPEYNTGSQGFTINNVTQPYHIPDYYTIDLQLSYEFGKHKTEGRKWYDGVEDNTDKNNYDILGRFVYFELSKKF